MIKYLSYICMAIIVACSGIPTVKATPLHNKVKKKKGAYEVVDTVKAPKKSVIGKIIQYFTDSNKKPITNKLDFSVIGGPHYSSDTQLGLGLIAAGVYRTDVNDTLLPPSNLSFYGDFSTVGFYMFGLRGNHLLPKDKYRFNYNLYFYSFPSYYWGKGYDAGRYETHKTDYERLQAQMKLDFMFKIAKNFYAGPMLQFDYIDAKKVADRSLWNGEKMAIFNTSLGGVIQYDSRDALTAPHKGLYVRLEQRFAPSFLFNKKQFGTTMFTISHYRELWKNAVLASQFKCNLNYGSVPWGQDATLGGSYSMRGYYEGKYRDNCSADAQIELRQTIYGRHGVALWVGGGEVFPSLKNFTMKHLLPNYGFGYRWEFKSRMNIRLDLGFGKGEQGFIFNINEAF